MTNFILISLDYKNSLILLGVTVEQKGAHDVTIRRTGHDRLRVTVLLAAQADGVKLKPLLVIPRKRPIPNIDPRKRLSIVY